MKTASSPPNGVHKLLRSAVAVEPEEVRALGWACLYFFCILSAYYVIRPLREEMAVAGGTRNIPWLFTATMVCMFLAHPPYSALVARFPRRTFVPIATRFFISNLLIFFVVLKFLPEGQQVWAGRVFFVWTAVFNLFVISVFWSFMADVFSSAQGKRLFGFIGFGGTFGGIVGSGLTGLLAPKLGPANLLIFSVLLLELSTLAVRRLSAMSDETARRANQPEDTAVGGGILAGVGHALSSPYLLGICAYMLLFTIGSTTLYLAQADIADQSFTDRGLRTAFFARIDLIVNILTLFTQVFLTGRIVKLLGVAVTLTLLPALSAIGFLALGFWPTIAVFVVFQVLRRSGEFAVARPAREVLYTVLPREDKFKAKNFIDTFVYRLGDQVGAWATSAYKGLGLNLAAEAFIAVPLSLIWLGVGLWLGRQQERQAKRG